MPDELPAAVTTALEELRQRLRQPKTVELAIKQYVVGEIVKTLLDLDTGSDPDSSEIPIMATSRVARADDETLTACVTSDYTVLGIHVYTHEVCATTTDLGGHVTVSL